VKNAIQVTGLLNPHFEPPIPLWSRVHSLHFRFLSMVFNSDFPVFVISLSSSAVHSAPNAGTVTSSATGVYAVDAALTEGESGCLSGR
jgi:hypothetical protein